MEILISRKTLIFIIISIVLTLAIVMLIPNLPTNKNGDDSKLPKVVVGGKVVQEIVKKGIKYFFKKPLSKRHVIQKMLMISMPV